MSGIMKMSVAISLIAGFSTIAFAEKPFVVMKSGKRSFFDKITADGGSLRVKSGSISRKIRKGDYLYARVPLPSIVRKAYKSLRAKKYDEAIKLFSKAYREYKWLGWGEFSIWRMAEAYCDSGKKDAAISTLQKLTGKPNDPASMKFYIQAKRLLADLYKQTGQFDKAKSVLNELAACNDEAVAAFSNNLLGDILLKEGKRKDATLMYLRTVLLFSKDNTKERPEALVKVIKILKEDKNNKYKDFVKILKTDYPSSKFTKDL